MTRYVGQRVKRTEDPQLIKGLGQYVDDIKLPDTLHVALSRSIYAHARIKSIDVSKAAGAPGLIAVYTGKDIVGKIGPLLCGFKMPGLKVTEHTVLATDKVYFVGHPVAAVVATDRYAAQDAVELIAVDYEELPAVVDLEAAAQDGSVIHEQYGDNIAYKLTIGSGDIDAALRSAERVIKQRIVNQRVAPLAMEPRGVLARYLPGQQELTVWSSTQIPHLLRTQLSRLLSIAENKLRVIAPEVGGGFGGKVNIFVEEALLGWIAIELGKPVKWIETRRENLQTTPHGRGQDGYIEVGYQTDGTLVGLFYNVFADMGAYCQLYTPVMPLTTAMMLSGCYKIPAVQTNVTAVFTNKMATDSYRGAGGPEATYAVERAIDMVAADLGLDPIQVRRKNFIAPEEFPYRSATGVVYDCGNYDGALQRALEIADYYRLREEQKRAREQGRIMGIGISTYAELCGVGPSRGSPTGMGGWESATVRVEPTGKVTVLTGVSPHGQGTETAFAQVAADALGVDMGDVTVIHGDTLTVQYGIGTFGSRATAVGGAALVKALEKVKEKATRIAARRLNADEASVSFREGRFFVQTAKAATVGVREAVAPAEQVPSQRSPAALLPEPETDGRSITIQEVALAAYVAGDLPPEMEPGLWATSVFDPSNFTASFGTHIAVIEIDCETGEINFLRFIGVDDCGKVINPLLVDGQIHGGIAQAIGQALYEEIVYDEQGQLVTGTLMDYAVPRARMLPWFELDRTETPSPVNPLGAKGVGEAGTIGATPAVVNAVVDALSPFGVRHLDMAIKPETVWRIINQKS
ncbi:molybdopterin-dependent oxidoreductase [soil metagenome]